MDTEDLIFNFIKKTNRITTADLVGKTGFSRAYAHRFLKKLVDEGALVRVGKANQAHYVLPARKDMAHSGPASIRKILTNRGLAEDRILDQIRQESSVYQGLSDNVAAILDYAFTEMLNNAIEHSGSEKIDMFMLKTANDLRFTVKDWGVGIYNNIMEKKRLASTMEAIQDLLKGKETTAPEAHSGEGVFFTSKIADRLMISSFEKKLIFDNIGHDILVRDIRTSKGTRVDFMINLKSPKKLSDLFRQYIDDNFQFSKTGVKAKMFQAGVDYISRSQARRMMAGLDKFKTITLDFQGVATVGQAFADEVFRVWQGAHRDIQLITLNANENIMLMIRRANI